MCLYNIIAQTQSQSRSLPRRLSSEEWLKYLIYNVLRNASAVIFYSNLYFTIQLFSTNRYSRLIHSIQLPLFLINCIKGIIQQVEQYSADILRYNLHLSKAIIKCCIDGSIKLFIFRP